MAYLKVLFNNLKVFSEGKRGGVAGLELRLLCGEEKREERGGWEGEGGEERKRKKGMANLFGMIAGESC